MAVADWDFNDANWQLDNTHFISAPTALNGKVPYCRGILCRKAESLVLPEGRIVTSVYLTPLAIAQIVFRGQYTLGDAYLTYNYVVQFFTDYWVSFMLYWDSTLMDSQNWPIKPTNNTWQRWRVTWWNGVDEQNTPAIAVELEQEIAGVWTSYGVFYDPNNRWKDSDKNRCGLGFLHSTAWFDDTQIWIPL